mgnify:CR=1 FL=1
MNLTPCGPSNSVLESDLELAVTQQTLTKLSIAETADGFFVVARLHWSSEKDWYLTTRRERNRPRLFKDLNRLNDFLRAAYPTDTVELVRNQRLPDPCDSPQVIKRDTNSTQHKH